MKAPPYALRMISATLGTVASAIAYRILAPWRMMAAVLLRDAGRKPGTSTSDTIGTLKASQKRRKRAALSEESMSREAA